METKICSSCKQEKLITEFPKNKSRHKCKSCIYIYNKKWRENNKDYHNAKSAEYQKNNKEKIKASNKKKYQDNKEQIKAQVKAYREANPEKVKESVKKYTAKNKDKMLQYWKEYRKKNADHRRELKRAYDNNKRKTNPSLKLRRSVSNAVYCAILRAGSKKDGSILKHLPYTMEELKNHIEGMFEPWMNWDNWGVYDPSTWDDNDSSTWTWNIDHITMQSELKYDSFDHPNFQKCWALENLRPMSSKINVKENKFFLRNKEVTI